MQCVLSEHFYLIFKVHINLHTCGIKNALHTKKGCSQTVQLDLVLDSKLSSSWYKMYIILGMHMRIIA